MIHIGLLALMVRRGMIEIAAVIVVAVPANILKP
jgi:hypothetical protein